MTILTGQPLRVLVVSQFFGPDSAAVGQFLADAVDALSASGQSVRVICGQSDYGATRSLDACYRMQSGGGPVSIVRVGNFAFSHQRIRKLLSYATFYAGAVSKALTGPRPDVVLTLTAPPGLAWIGWLLKRARRCRHVVWEMDVYPDIAAALGMRLPPVLGRLLDYPRRRADVVIALGDCMKARLLRHGISNERIWVVENWADGQMTYPLPFPEQPPLRILYSGNLGLSHEVETVKELMERLAGHPGFHFEFAGGGPRRKDLDDFCRSRSIGNASFRSYVRHEQLGASLAEGHIGLVTQKPATLGAVVPSKVYGLMAAGRPVLYIGPAAATPARLIRRFDCGWHSECGDVEGLVELLVHLLNHPEEIRKKGGLGRKAFLAHYDKPAGVARICQALGVEPAVRHLPELTHSTNL